MKAIQSDIYHYKNNITYRRLLYQDTLGLRFLEIPRRVKQIIVEIN